MAITDDHMTIERLTEALAKLREQLEVEQINYRQTIDRYSDDIETLEQTLAEAEAKVEKMREAIDGVLTALPGWDLPGLREALK